MGVLCVQPVGICVGGMSSAFGSAVRAGVDVMRASDGGAELIVCV